VLFILAARNRYRRDYANGYRSKTIATRVGKITFDVPQVRQSDFYPNSLKKRLRSERALKLALAEMYIQGVSTRKVANWMEANIPESFTIFAFPAAHQRRLRTANGLERLNREVRRRSRVAVLFPNEASCLRLVTAIVMEISDEWETGRIYLGLDKI
jgi:transposase-like protein